MIFFRFTLVVFSFLLVSWHPSKKNQIKRTTNEGKNYALILAADNYIHAWDKLYHPINDGKTVEQLLGGLYDFKVDLVQNPSRDTIIAKLKKYERMSFGPYDQLFIFFTGHGGLSSKNGAFIIPVDGRLPRDEPSLESCISHATLRTLIDKIQCRHILLALDACYSGRITQMRGVPVDTLSRLIDFEQVITQDIQNRSRFAVPSKLCLTSGDHETYDNSSFSKLLIAALYSVPINKTLTFAGLWSFLEKAETRPRRTWFNYSDNLDDQDFLFTRNNRQWLDTDQDKIPDHLDECPTVAGSPGAKGCKDRDEDGFHDGVDDCPEQHGDKDGCSDFYPGLRTPVPPPGMVFVRGGVFDMGNVFGAEGQYTEAATKVEINSFFIAQHEVTFAEFDLYYQATQGHYPRDEGWGRGRMPVIYVDWYDAAEYCNWRSAREGLIPVYYINKNAKDFNNVNNLDTKRWIVEINQDANGYRLPTEAEWEYSARERGRKLRFGNGNNIAYAEQINFDCSGSLQKSYSRSSMFVNKKTVPVGSFGPNGLGIYDMSGNVAEWCQDWYAPLNFQGTNKTQFGSGKVFRGGSWHSSPEGCQTTIRFYYAASDRSPVIGFRLVRSYFP